MRTPLLTSLLFTLILSLLTCCSANAITINLQYSTGPLFYSGIDGTAKAAINAAAADISAAITTSLNAINSDTVTGSYNGTTSDFDASFYYTYPSTGGQATIASATLAADEVKLFVGTRFITGNTLGVGGSGGTVAGITGASGSPDGWVNAVADAEAQLSSRYQRGGGPIIGTSSGNSTYGPASASYEISFGLSVGNLWFDIDSNNNGSQDSSAQLDDYWHWNHNTVVGSGKNDLYSVALHEILHAIGIGASESWDDQRSGTTWNGSEVQALTGSGSNLIYGDGSHIASSVMSTRISDGSPQEVVMDPNITQGTRKELTELDLAFLRDIGYETITPATDPADFNGDTYVNAADLAIWQSGFGSNSTGDTDGDSDTDGSDFLTWQRNYTGGGSTLSAVPEPTSLGLLMLGSLLLVGRRRR